MSRPDFDRPPDRQGVRASSVVLPSSFRGLLLDFLCQRFPRLDEGQWRARLDQGLVLGPDFQPLAAASRPTPGSRLFYYRVEDGEEAALRPITVVHEDDELLVADKPAFMPVLPQGRHVQGSLLVQIKRLRPELAELSPAHRIDMDTSGLVLFTKQAAWRAPFQNLFRDRTVHKRYEALVRWPPSAQPQDHPGDAAETWTPGALWFSELVQREHFIPMHEARFWCRQHPADSALLPPGLACTRLLDRQDRGAGVQWLSLQPHTGQKHQLRAQLNARGTPILHDRIYPELLPFDEPADPKRPLALLAAELGFTDPRDGQPRLWQSRLRLTEPA